MTWWWLAALAVGVFLGIAASILAYPQWRVWRSRPRENRRERRRRRCRVALFEADQLLADEYARAALRVARRAYRLEPGNPHMHACMGTILVALKRYEKALKHFEQAHEIMADEGEIVAVTAVEAARCCARLRSDARTQREQEARAEQVLLWARIAARADPPAVHVLAEDPLLRDLCGQVRLLHHGAWEARP